ncbi:MAG: AAA family ATPase [Nitrospirae bacterium]|nr:AAA family ATPase [Nitrospirota bacterium]
MYRKHFGLRDKPFNLTPDPEYLYVSRFHKEALERLLTVLGGQNRLVVFTGEIGSGKTVMLRTFAKYVPSEIGFVQLSYAGDNPAQLLQVLLHELGVSATVSGIEALRAEIRRVVAERAKDGGKILFLIDEAQNIGRAALEEVVGLLDIEVAVRRPVLMVLAGLPKLKEHFSPPDGINLKTDGVTWYHLGLLSPEEVSRYIRRRLSVAGSRSASIFNDDAILEIAKASGGTPRLINMICDTALLDGYFMEEKVITREIVREVLDELLYKTMPAADAAPRKEEVSLVPDMDQAVPAEPAPSKDSVPLAKTDAASAGRKTVAAAKSRAVESGLQTVSVVNDPVRGLRDKVGEFVKSLSGAGLPEDAVFEALREYLCMGKKPSDSVVRHVHECRGGDAIKDSVALPLTVFILEKNARMSMHLENKFNEIDIAVKVFHNTEGLFEALDEADCYGVHILVADVEFFSGSGRGDVQSGKSALDRLRGEFPYIPIIMTSVIPLTAMRARLLQLGLPILLHKPDLGSMDLSQVRDHFNRFFDEVAGVMNGIHSLMNGFFYRFHDSARTAGYR